MKEDVMLALMLKRSVVAWNPADYNYSLTTIEFFTLAKLYKYAVSEFSDGTLIAYQFPHNLESACASMGIEFMSKEKKVV